MNAKSHAPQTNVPARRRGFRHEFVINETDCGLLYRHGLYVRRINAGRHIVWGFGWSVNTIDLRKRVLAIAARDVRSADHVGLTLGVAVTFQIGEPVKALHEVQDWHGCLDNAAQLAVHSLIAAHPVEALFARRPDFGAQLLDKLRPEAERFGITVHAAELKDVIVPAGHAPPPPVPGTRAA